jgi:hypothetical protein
LRFPIQPAAKTHYGGADSLFGRDLIGKPLHTFPDHALWFEDFANARVSGLLDSSFGRPACSFA